MNNVNMKKTIKYEILQHFLRPRTRVPSKVMSYAWVIGMAAYQDDTSHPHMQIFRTIPFQLYCRHCQICKYLKQTSFNNLMQWKVMKKLTFNLNFKKEEKTSAILTESGYADTPVHSKMYVLIWHGIESVGLLKALHNRQAYSF